MELKPVDPGPTAGQDQRKLKESVQEFEAMFIHQLFKEMRKTQNPSWALGSSGPSQQIYQDMMDQEVSREMAKKGGIGLAPILLRQIKQNDSSLGDIGR